MCRSQRRRHAVDHIVRRCVFQSLCLVLCILARKLEYRAEIAGENVVSAERAESYSLTLRCQLHPVV